MYTIANAGPFPLVRYVGLPFGAGPGQVTCWSLVRAVYRECLGIDLPAYGEISAHDLLRVAREMDRGQAEECWAAVETPQAFDVVLMRSHRGGRSIVHVGVMVDAVRMLHVVEASAAVLVPIRHVSVAGRIAGFRRYVC